MSNNSFFRDLLTSGELGGKEKAGPSKEERAASRAVKQTKAKESYERRMAIQKKREERLAEESRYRDRAEERRKAEAKAGGAEVPPPSAYDEPVDKDDEADLPSGPTFAQVGNREDLSQQSHRMSIAQSKYLGGDIEHTHLVKGLDYALLQKSRAEQSAVREKAEREKRERERQLEAKSAKAAPAADPKRPRHAKGEGAAPKLAKASAGAAAPANHVAAESEFAASMLRSLGAAPSRPNRALVSGRLVLEYALGEGSFDAPNSVVRAEDDLRVRTARKLAPAGLPPALLARMGKVMAYCARGGGERARAKKKSSSLLAPSAVLSMKPLERSLPSRVATPPPAEEAAASVAASAAPPPPAGASPP